MLHLTTGALISYDHVTEPFLIYGKIYTFWTDLGGVKGGLGHPLADPKILPSGATCSIFVGGHVHHNGTRDPELLATSSLCLSTPSYVLSLVSPQPSAILKTSQLFQRLYGREQGIGYVLFPSFDSSLIDVFTCSRLCSVTN